MTEVTIDRGRERALRTRARNMGLRVGRSRRRSEAGQLRHHRRRSEAGQYITDAFGHDAFPLDEKRRVYGSLDAVEAALGAEDARQRELRMAPKKTAEVGVSLVLAVPGGRGRGEDPGRELSWLEPEWLP